MKLSKSQSMLILLSLKASMQLGYSLQKAIKMQAESQSGKLGKVLAEVSYLINTKEKPVADVLHKFGIVNLKEKYLIENSGNNAKKTIEEIIRMREINGLFTKTLLSILWIPLGAPIVGAAIILFVIPMFNEPVQVLIQAAQMKGVHVSMYTGFWYIDHYKELPFVLSVYIAFLVFIAILYFYLKRFKPTVIYKLFSLSAYDDVPVILRYMKALKDTGLSPIKIAEILEKSNYNPGWVRLFKGLKRAINASTPLWKEFYKFGFPKDVIIFMRYAEEGKSFWENVDSMISFAETKAKDGNEFVRKVWGQMLMYIGYFIIAFFLIGLVMYVFQIQTVAIALQ